MYFSLIDSASCVISEIIRLWQGIHQKESYLQMSDPVYNVQIELLCYYNINYQFSFSLQRIGPIWRQSMISKDSVYIILHYIILYIIFYYIIIIFRDSPVHAVWHLGRTVTVTSTGLDSRPVISIMSPSICLTSSKSQCFFINIHQWWPPSSSSAPA